MTCMVEQAIEHIRFVLDRFDGHGSRQSDEAYEALGALAAEVERLTGELAEGRPIRGRMLADRERAEAAEAEVERLREAMDTADWLLHIDRQSDDPRKAAALTKGERVKHDVAELLRAALAVSTRGEPAGQR